MEHLKPCTNKPIPHGDLPLRQRALVETLLAYYYRGKAVQYDSVLMTVQEKYAGGDLRETDFCSPEMATEDSPMFAVCSSYPWEALYEAFGYQMEGAPLNFKSFKIVHTPADNPILAYRYYETEQRPDCENPDMEARKAAAKAMFDTLQVGDIIVTDCKTGHTMAYLGDFLGDGHNYLMHCAGKKYDMETAKENWENGRGNDTGGAIRIDEAEYFFFGEKKQGKPMWPISTHPRMVVLRPLQAMDEKAYPISPSAMTRLRYPRLSYDRRASCNRFTSCQNGGKITLTVTVKNNATSDYLQPITVTEHVPENCRLQKASVTGGGKVCGGTITWEKTLKKGEAAVLAYTVEVSAPRGAAVVFAGGTCGTIPSNTITVQVGGKGLTDAQRETMAELADGAALPKGDFVNGFYRDILGLDPKIPTLKEVEQHLFTLGAEPEAPVEMLHLTENNEKPFQKQAEMLVPGWFGGMEVKASYADRILTTTAQFLQPGDVILSQTGAKDFGLPAELIYLGCDRVAAAGEDSIRVLDAKELDKLLPSRLFVCLRPTMAYDDIHAETAVKQAADVDFSAIPDGPEKEELLKKYQSDAEKQARLDARAAAQKEFALRQKAVVETALAYYRRGTALQYDSTALNNATTRDGVGADRTTPYRSPEASTLQDPGYFVCSSFTYQVYREAFDYNICQDADHCTCAHQIDTHDHSVVYYWHEDSGESKQTAISVIRQLLQPGDILTTRKKTAHSMLFLGDCMGDGRDYIIHSWGKKYNMNTGRDAYEQNGTITLQHVEELCFVEGHKEWYKDTKTPRWSLFDDQREIIVLRPLRVIQTPMSSNAAARLRHPGLDISRTCSVPKYRDVALGEEITVTTVVKNCGKDAVRDLPVTEILPENARLTATCGQQQGNTLRWLLDLDAGREKTVSFTVCITEGESITLAGGNVGGIAMNKICRRVKPQNVTAPQDLPAALCSILRKVEHAPGQNGPLVEFTEKPLWLVPGFWGGKMLAEKERILEFSLDRLADGDILVVAADPLGDAKFETYTKEQITEELLWSLFAKDFFCLIRV